MLTHVSNRKSERCLPALAVRGRNDGIASDVGGARELARRGGLENENHVNSAISRLRADPEHDPAQSLLRDAARGAGVSVHWLVTGKGPKRTTALEETKSWTEIHEKVAREYPGLPVADVGALVTPEPIADVDAMLVADLARAWFAAKARSLVAPPWATTEAKPAVGIAPRRRKRDSAASTAAHAPDLAPVAKSARRTTKK